MAPLVSVLMAAYNAEDYLSTAVQSVLCQDMADLELIIGDNASSDVTATIVERYVRQDRRVQYFRNPRNLGATANWNLCYQHAHPSGKYFALLASDDWWEPAFLSRLVAVADAEPSVAFVHSDMYRTEHDRTVINRYSQIWKHLPPAGEHCAVQELYQGCYINIMAALVDRRKMFRAYPHEGLFAPDLELTPDFHLWLQLLTRGARAFYVPEPLAYYRKHAGAMTMPENETARLLEEIAIFRDKLQGVCPAGLEPVRREALANRLALLGFTLLDAGRAGEARHSLREARQVTIRRHLDVDVARVISSLPLTAGMRAGLWQAALSAARVMKRNTNGAHPPQLDAPLSTGESLSSRSA